MPKAPIKRAVINFCHQIKNAIKAWSDKRRNDIRVVPLRYGDENALSSIGYKFESLQGPPTDIQRREIDELWSFIKKEFCVTFSIEQDSKGKSIIWRLPLSAVPVS